MAHAEMVETATRLSIEYAISYDDALRRLKYIDAFEARADSAEARVEELEIAIQSWHEEKAKWRAELDRMWEVLVHLYVRSPGRNTWDKVSAAYKARDLDALEAALKGGDDG